MILINTKMFLEHNKKYTNIFIGTVHWHLQYYSKAALDIYVMNKII